MVVVSMASLGSTPQARLSRKYQALPHGSASTDAPRPACIAKLSTLGGPELVLPSWFFCEECHARDCQCQP